MGAIPVEALLDDGPVLATLIRIELPDGVACLTDGGFVDYAGERYLGNHPDYGILSAVSPIRDGAETQETRIDLTLFTGSDEGLAALSSPVAQDSRIQWWEGVIDPVSGLLIGEPDLMYDGVLDVAHLSVGSERPLVLTCGSQAERQLEPNADWRLNHNFHTRIWGPEERGLEHMTNVLKKSEWRERPPNPNTFKRLFLQLVPLWPR